MMTQNLYKWNDSAKIFSYSDGSLDLSIDELVLSFSKDDKSLHDLLKLTELERGILRGDAVSKSSLSLIDELLDNNFLFRIPKELNTDLLYTIKQNIPVFPQDIVCDITSKISNANICIIGVGTLTSWLAPHLTSLGMANLYFVDYDIVNQHNISRSPVFSLGMIGKSKVNVFANYFERKGFHGQLYAINKKIKSITSIEEAIGEFNIDLIILTADEPSELLSKIMFEYSYNKKIPVIRGSRLGVGPISVPGRTRKCLSCEYEIEYEVDNKVIDSSSTRRLNAKIRKDINTTRPALVASYIFEFLIKILAQKYAPKEYENDIMIDECGTREELVEIFSKKYRCCSE